MLLWLGLALIAIRLPERVLKPGQPRGSGGDAEVGRREVGVRHGRHHAQAVDHLLRALLRRHLQVGEARAHRRVGQRAPVAQVLASHAVALGGRVARLRMPITRPIGVVYRRDPHPAPAVARFLALVASTASTAGAGTTGAGTTGPAATEAAATGAGATGVGATGPDATGSDVIRPDATGAG